MNKIIQIFLPFLALVSTAMAHAQSPVWKVSNGEGRYFYLAGSVHMLRENDAVPEAFDEAYRDSQLLVLENVCPKGVKTQHLPEGEQLSGQLRPEVFDMLVSSMTVQIRKDLESLRKMNAEQPGIVGAGIINASETEYLDFINKFRAELQALNPYAATHAARNFLYLNAGYKGEHGLDAKYTEKAKKENRDIRPLETCAYASAALGRRRGYGDNYVRNTIRNGYDLDKMPGFLAEWRKGESGILTGIMRRDKRENPDVYEVTVTERNANWLPQLEGLLAEPRHALVLVGYSHLVAPGDGLLQSLRRRGYQVKQQH